MGNSHDYVALDWVRGEIDETLNQARQALEAYVDNTEDTSRMRFCLNYIHQVHGTLQMVEFYGAALLAEEMEKLAQALLNQAVPNLQDAVEVLMQAVLQLPSYLEHLHAGRKDLPLVILPILNDLRASRGEALLSDTSLFTPDLAPVKIKPSAGAAQRLQDEKIIASLRKLRQMFQFSLAGVIRGNEVSANTAYMIKVLSRVERLCQHTPLGQLWSVAIGFVDILDSDPKEITSATKTLLRDLDHQIKRLIDESVDILLQPIPEDLLKHLLYYIAKSDARSDKIESVRKIFNLDQSLPKEDEVNAERQHMQGPNKDAIESVVTALNEELARIKDQLDLFVRGEFRDNADLDELLPGLKQVANTMAVLGLGIPRKVILDQVEIIEQLIEERGEAEDSTLMDIAGALLYVEATLTGMTEEHAPTLSKNVDSDIPVEQLNNAHDAVLRETRNGLEQAKTSIVNFIASQWDHNEIEAVPAILDGLRGGLQIIPLTKAAELLSSCSQYIQQALLSSKTVPDWKQLDTLADAITSIEYYIERLTEGAQDNELILQVAEESVIELGFPPGQTPTYTQPENIGIAADTVEPTETQPLTNESANKESDADLIDDEIIEIFIEEAEEVLETIGTNYPKFHKNTEEKDAIIELRRAFHTLKGSGRLVGAVTLGELAWATENMLNRILDNTVQPSSEMLSLLDTVISKLPQLVDDFKNNNQSDDISSLTDQANTLAGVPKASVQKEESVKEMPVEDIEPTEIEVEINQESEELLPAEAIIEEPLPIIEPATVPEVTSADDDDLIDDEIIEIFIEEAEEVLESIANYLPIYLEQPDNSEALTELRRAYHTLKGSGRMVGANVIGELAWSAENMMNRIIDGSILMSPDVANVLGNATALIPGLVEDFKLHRPASIDVSPIIEQAEQLAQGELVVSQSQDEEPNGDFDFDSDTDIGVDPVLLDIFRSETDTHLETINAFIEKANVEGELAFTDSISRALHTLKGSANTASIEPIANIIVPVEKFVKEARALNILANPAIADMLSQASAYVRQGIEQLYNDPQHHIEGTDAFLSHLAELSELTFTEVRDVEQTQSTTSDPQLINIFLTEGIDILLDAESVLSNWSHNPVPGEELEKLVGELKTLSHGAQVAGLDDISEFADLLEHAYESIESGNIVANENFLTTIAQGHEALLNLMDQVAAGLATQPDNKLIAQIKDLIQSIADAKTAEQEAEEKALLDEAEAQEASKQALAEQEALKELDEELEVEIPTLSEFEMDAEEVPLLDVIEEQTETLLPETAEAPLLDPELVEIFLEEANDIVNNTGELLQQWSEATDSHELLVELQRELHTLKGGARMAGVASIGDLSHELETLFEGLTEKRLTANESLVALLFSCHDRLASMVEDIAAGSTSTPASDLIAKIQDYISSPNEQISVNTAQEERVDLVNDIEINETDLNISDTETTEEIEASESSLIDQDPELIEIFLEEANDIIGNSGNLINQWQENPEQHALIHELQRELHTLKGGARMAELSAIGDLAHELESLFEKVVDGQIQADSQITDLSLEVHDRLATMVDDIAESKPCSPAPDLISQISALLHAEPLEDQGVEKTDEDVLVEQVQIEAPEEESESIDYGEIPTLELGDEELSDTTEQNATDLEDINLDGIETQETELNEAVSTDSSELAEDIAEEFIASVPIEDITPEENVIEDAVPETIDSTETEGVFNSSTLDPELTEIFLEEAQEIIDKTAGLLQSWLEEINDHSHVKELQRELHTLKGGARMAEISPLGDLAHELETLFEGIVDGKITVNDSISDLMLACHDKLANMVEQLENNEGIYPANDLIASVIALINGEELHTTIEEALPHIDDAEIEEAISTEEIAEVEESIEAEIEELEEDSDAELMNIFIDEARDIHNAMLTSLEYWNEDPKSLNSITELLQELHTLKGGSRLADMDSIGDLADALFEKLEETLNCGGTGNLELVQMTAKATEQVSNMLDELEASGQVSPSTDTIKQIKQTNVGAATTEQSKEQDTAVNEIDKDFSIDIEILEIFLEEANEILETLETQLADWSTDASNDDFNREIQRLLHTLKGGARLAGLTELGNVSHEMESRLIEAIDDGKGLDGQLKTAIHGYQDKLASLVTEVNHRFIALSTTSETEETTEQAATESKAQTKAAHIPEQTQEVTNETIASEAKQEEPEQATPETSVSEEQDRVTTTAKAPAETQQQAKARPAQQETVRVAATLIDDLVNLAGESSITRGRLEQQISDFSFNLDEMVSTIERLREQLRRMDMETEAQVLFRTEKEGVGPDYADFDPLEMDRYSSIQQLSRALTESTFDLLDLRETLADKARDAETLLLQQSRIHTELQEGLMKTRLIPFSSMVPRLRRIVRQIGGELGKKVEFNINNAEGEMDRTVLERMVAPLEHMVRNALDHGIESADKRKAAGKPEAGNIDLSLTREGGDIVLRMKDDGGGIPVQVIRDKAISQGLIKENARLSDHEILQFIMQAGFSTAEHVTQISGRGVGMDVVSSEIKQLGGNITIESKEGYGTTFVVRLPFTVSVNRALMVNTGEDFYAIPLNTIEGIVRVSPYELEEYYKPDAPLYEYAGQQYNLQYLGNVLHSEHKPKLQGQPLPLPVILVRGADKPIALQVDSLMGSREIVVKSLGPQFTKVPGVSGATILGDGNVVVILDLPALIRADIEAIEQGMESIVETPAPLEQRPTMVMVVDDSVTVRKVTTRLLERNGMEVVTAKDGVDAIAQLQDHKPDVMLLDIEMPRMDGFEVASLVRHDENLKNVPICMITSRTGQKHRERAMSIGVNEYLGKPFQEKELLSTIEKLTNQS